MTECLFCKMAFGEIKPNWVYEDPDIMAFKDINPQAPTHVLIVPRRHIATLNDSGEPDAALLGKMLVIASQIAVSQEIAETGYRVVLNCNRDGGQSVFHIHMHLLGGRALRWPPG